MRIYMKDYFNIILIILVILFFCKSVEGWANAEACEASVYGADSFCPEEGCTGPGGTIIPGVPGGTSVTGLSSLGYYDCLEVGDPVCGTGYCAEIQPGNFQCAYPGSNSEFSMGTFQTPDCRGFSASQLGSLSGADAAACEQSRQDYCSARESYKNTSTPKPKNKSGSCDATSGTADIYREICRVMDRTDCEASIALGCIWNQQ
jgi:hypothetical protein